MLFFYLIYIIGHMWYPKYFHQKRITYRSFTGKMRPGQGEVPRPPPPEEPPAALLLLELPLDDGRAVGRQEAERALGVRAQEAAPRGVRGARAAARQRGQLEHVEEAGRAELVEDHLLLLGVGSPRIGVCMERSLFYIMDTFASDHRLACR